MCECVCSINLCVLYVCKCVPECVHKFCVLNNVQVFLCVRSDYVCLCMCMYSIACLLLC